MGYLSYNPLTAVTLGLKESVNVCSLSILLIFMVFLYFTANTPRKFFIGGTFFVVAAGVVKYLQTLGIFDLVLVKLFIDPFIQVFYILLGFIFLYVGGVLFKKWLLIKKGSLGAVALAPFLSDDYLKSRKLSFFERAGENLYLFFLAAVVGGGMSFISIAWPQNYFLFLVYFTASTEYKYKGLLTLWLYVAAYLFLHTLMWFLAYCALNQDAWRKKIVARASLVIIVLSALFFGVGINLLFIFTLKA